MSIVVMGGDSHSEGCGFESFFHINWLQDWIDVCLKKPENKRKRGRGCSNFSKKVCNFYSKCKIMHPISSAGIRSPNLSILSLLPQPPIRCYCQNNFKIFRCNNDGQGPVNFYVTLVLNTTIG